MNIIMHSFFRYQKTDEFFNFFRTMKILILG
jgi:pentatricopeptide repeat protein